MYSGKSTKQRQIILSAEEQDLLISVIRQHAKIAIIISSFSSLKLIGAWAESDVVTGDQKGCVNQAPSCRKNIGILYAALINKPPINDVLVKLKYRGDRPNGFRSGDVSWS